MIEINTINDTVDFNKLNRILVIKLQHLGDVLLTTPLYHVLHHKFPSLTIDVLVYQETTDILQNNPDINQTYAIDRNWKKKGVFLQFSKELQILNQLKKNQYDLVINLTDRWRGAWLTRMINPAYSVSQAYKHKRGDFWRRSFSHIYSQPPAHRHTVETNLDAIRRLGQVIDTKNRNLILHVNQDVQLYAKNQIQPFLNQQQKLVVIHPTSRWMFKAWTPENFVKVIDLFKAKNYAVALVSGPASVEIDYVNNISKLCDQTVANFAGQFSLQQTAAMIKQADCLLGLDSVAMHIAAAVGTSCVALFGPTKDKLWHPWSVEHRIISEPYACRPCGLKGCGDGMISECLLAIKPETVVEAVSELITLQS